MSILTELYEDGKKEGYKSGFSDGIAYVFGHLAQDKLSEKDLMRFADWLESRADWKTAGEWQALIEANYIRLTKDVYDGCKHSYAASREKYKDDAFWYKFYTDAEKNLDEQWKRIQETGAWR